MNPNIPASNHLKQGEDIVRINRERRKAFYEKLTELKAGNRYTLRAHRIVEDREKGEINSTREKVPFITGITLENALRLMTEFQLPGFIYMGEETDGKVCLFGKDGIISESCDEAPLQIAGLFSGMMGAKYAFEMKPSGVMESMISSKMAREIKGIKRWHEAENWDFFFSMK